MVSKLELFAKLLISLNKKGNNTNENGRHWNSNPTSVSIPDLSPKELTRIICGDKEHGKSFNFRTPSTPR